MGKEYVMTMCNDCEDQHLEEDKYISTDEMDVAQWNLPRQIEDAMKLHHKNTEDPNINYGHGHGHFTLTNSKGRDFRIVEFFNGHIINQNDI